MKQVAVLISLFLGIALAGCSGGSGDELKGEGGADLGSSATVSLLTSDEVALILSANGNSIKALIDSVQDIVHQRADRGEIDSAEQMSDLLDSSFAIQCEQGTCSVKGK